MGATEGYRNEILDRYLGLGWFRMYDTMFTTDAIDDGRYVHKVFWLRYRVDKITYGRRQKDIINRNRKFTLTYKPLLITPELEALFALYKTAKPFVGYQSLANAFTTNGPVFDTWQVAVRDGDVLIAAGIFDRGKDSVAGIMNFYNPAYSRYSPGKLLLLAKINFCMRNNISLYYPGYITKSPSLFDYKLFPCKQATDVFLEASCTWVSYNTWKAKHDEE